MIKRLLILASDHVSEWIKKGEVLERYYNPKDFFDEVHLLLLNNDRPDLKEVQRMAGRAKVTIHNYPEPSNFFSKTLGWQPVLISNWAHKGAEIIRDIKPSVVRCHGAHLNSFIADIAKKKFNIPYVVSMHINPDENYRRSAQTLKERLISSSLKKIERRGLRGADLVLPVYKPIVPYLESMGVEKYQVCYNVLNDTHLIKKNDFKLNTPVRIISIGRQCFQKNPTYLISALKSFQNVHLTLIGSGEYHEILKEQVKREKLSDKVTFIKAINNEELCESLHKYDFLAIHTDHFEISKVMLESFLIGLPVLLNFREGDQVPELNNDICLRVINSVEGYSLGLQKMITDDQFREKMGRRSYEVAQDNWAPKKCEKEYMEMYKSFFKHDS